MTIWREDQLNDVRDETVFQFRGERVLVKLPVQVCSALMQERMGAWTKDVMIVCVVGTAVEGGSGFLG